MKAVIVLILSFIHFCFNYEILSKNILIEIDPETNLAKVIETIEYQFQKDSYIKIEKIVPQVSGNVGNITVSSNNQNIDRYTIDDEENGSKIIRIYLKKLKDIQKVNVEFIYTISNVLNGTTTEIGISNKDTGNDITAHIDLTIKKLYEALTPEKVISNNIEEINNRVEIQSQTNASYYSYVVPASRKNFMREKYRKEAYHFNLPLRRNNTEYLKIKIDKIVSAQANNHSLILEKIRLRNETQKMIYNTHQLVETLVSLLIIALIIYSAILLTSKI